VPNNSPNHIVPLYRAPELAFTLANVAPCCTACNNAIDAMERKGLDVKPLFKDWIERAAAVDVGA
jgi:5-methylcytosine-specific restriction endonuclease McrA